MVVARAILSLMFVCANKICCPDTLKQKTDYSFFILLSIFPVRIPKKVSEPTDELEFTVIRCQQRLLR